MAQVEEAVDRLPELQRQALLLYWKEELSYTEIAEATGTNIGTVKSRLFRARDAVKDCLKKAIGDL